MRLTWVVGLTLINILGCAAIKPPSPTTVSFQSTPPGAEVTLNGVAIGSTPVTRDISCTTPQAVVFTLAGYEAYGQSIPTVTGLDSMGYGAIEWYTLRCAPVVSVVLTPQHAAR